jgi:hypothetical protein
VPGAGLPSFERFEKFVGLIARVPKEEADKVSREQSDKKTRTPDKCARRVKREVKGGKAMSETLLKNLEELVASIDKNTPKIEERLGASDPGGVVSAAKYREALERLSQE